MASIKLRNVNPVVFNYNVGLGDTNPTDKLVINEGSLRFDHDNTGHGIVFKSASSSGNKAGMFFKNSGGTEKFRLIFDESGDKTNDLRITSNSNATNCLTILQSGEVGVGGSPTKKFSISGPNSEFVAFEHADNDFRIGTWTSDTLAFIVNGSKKMTIASDGKAHVVGGVLQINEAGQTTYGTIQFGDTVTRSITGNSTELQIGTTINNLKFVGTATANITSNASDGTTPFKIYANVSQSSGSLLQIYNASSKKFDFSADGNFDVGTFADNGATAGFQIYNAWQIRTSANTSDNSTHHFFYNTNGLVGTIKTSGSATAFNTSSDYRLKEGIIKLSGAVDRVKLLSPINFNFKADKSKIVDGFLAHEVAEVVPEAVSGEKDAVTEDGKIDPQGIDQSKLVPLLTAAVQELTERVEALEN